MTQMAELQPLVGRWATTITMLYPPEIRGETHHAWDSYHWLTGGLVLVHDVEARMGEDFMHAIEIYHHDDDGKLVSRNYDGRGEISEYTAEMSEGVWRIQGRTERFASTVLDETSIKGLWQLKTDGGWVDWMIVDLDRIGPPPATDLADPLRAHAG